MCETKSVSGSLYLDLNENLPDVSQYEKEFSKAESDFKKGLLSDTTFESTCQKLNPLIAEGHNYRFIGKVGQFCPIKDGCGGGLLMREKDGKYYAATGTTKRFYGPSDGYTLTGGSTNNYSKRNPSLVADIWGDWREEIIMPVNKGSATDQAYLRIYTSTMPTDYRITTLMHDCQYRLSVAWQNVGYNQPTYRFCGTCNRRKRKYT